MTSNALATVVAQAGGNLLPDQDDIWTNRFEIRSETSNRLYVVAQKRSDGAWGCSCPAWRTRRYCKHLTALTPALARIGQEKPASAPTPLRRLGRR